MSVLPGWAGRRIACASVIWAQVVMLLGRKAVPLEQLLVALV